MVGSTYGSSSENWKIRMKLAEEHAGVKITTTAISKVEGMPSSFSNIAECLVRKLTKSTKNQAGEHEGIAWFVGFRVAHGGTEQITTCLVTATVYLYSAACSLRASCVREPPAIRGARPPVEHGNPESCA